MAQNPFLGVADRDHFPPFQDVFRVCKPCRQSLPPVERVDIPHVIDLAVAAAAPGNCALRSEDTKGVIQHARKSESKAGAQSMPEPHVEVSLEVCFCDHGRGLRRGPRIGSPSWGLCF
jgi:hypothetical protein